MQVTTFGNILGLDWMQLITILVILLAVFGATRVPKLLRNLTKTTKSADPNVKERK